MALLDSILQQYKPPEWDERNYANVRFVRIPLNQHQHSIEYNQIRSEFIQKFGGAQDVIKIERVQHPFAFARFKIRKEHIARKNGSVPLEERRFFPLTDANAIDKILEYNCDKRRGGCSYNSNLYYSSLSSGSGYVIAVKTFSNYDFDTRDTHRYPEYLIQYGMRRNSSSSSSDIDDLVSRLRIY